MSDCVEQAAIGPLHEKACAAEVFFVANSEFPACMNQAWRWQIEPELGLVIKNTCVEIMCLLYELLHHH